MTILTDAPKLSDHAVYHLKAMIAGGYTADPTCPECDQILAWARWLIAQDDAH